MSDTFTDESGMTDEVMTALTSAWFHMVINSGALKRVLVGTTTAPAL
ncbi:unannotated protein [freshwater metagenome]|uniref:Unannotated protein n=1 Tax=freshwater metagenome TaxID=449393 RepID=A0A6J6SIA7_9ZZZZ